MGHGGNGIARGLDRWRTRRMGSHPHQFEIVISGRVVDCLSAEDPG